MPFLRVRPDDDVAVETLLAILEAAAAVDDPAAPHSSVETLRGQLAHASGNHPAERFLYSPQPGDAAVAALTVAIPVHDNLHLVEGELCVHPAHRRRGHGTALMTELLHRTRAAGRTTIWVEAIDGDLAATAFAARHGFRLASRDARRHQHLPDVDWNEIDRQRAAAAARAADYRLERHRPPFSDDLLSELMEATNAINDSPMGELTHEDSIYDLARLQESELALAQRELRSYRVVARHRATGEVGGHTVLLVDGHLPHWGAQSDTAVARAHRGHRLGLLLKIEMMRWLAEVEPQVHTVRTWNNTANRFMIDVNEALGYRLSATFAIYQRTLPDAATST